MTIEVLPTAGVNNVEPLVESVTASKSAGFDFDELAIETQWMRDA